VLSSGMQSTGRLTVRLTDNGDELVVGCGVFYVLYSATLKPSFPVVIVSSDSSCRPLNFTQQLKMLLL